MIENVHERRIAASADEVGELLETWGSAGDRFWRTDVSEPAWLDRGLDVGSRGGHGPVRYTVTHHLPRRRVDLAFEPDLGLRGRHTFEIRPAGADACVARHELVAATEGWLTLLRPLLIALHDATVEDVLDHVQRELTGSANRGQPTSPVIRILGRTSRSRAVKSCGECPQDLAPSIGPIDASDCFTTVILPGDPTEPRRWAEQVFGRPPRWVGFLLSLRDAAVRPFGLRTPGHARPATGLPVLTDDGNELVMGLDDRHLDGRVRITARDRHVHLTTSVTINTRLGHIYWAVARHVHPLVVQSMLGSMPFPAVVIEPSNRVR